MILQIATALAIGAYVVLSKDAQPKRPDATARESIQHPADHLDRDARPEFSSIADYIPLTGDERSNRLGRCTRRPDSLRPISVHDAIPG